MIADIKETSKCTNKLRRGRLNQVIRKSKKNGKEKERKLSVFCEKNILLSNFMKQPFHVKGAKL